MESTPLQKVREIAEEYEKKISQITGKGWDFCRLVLVRHEDGSVFFFDNAYSLLYHGEGEDWFIVFTEHHGIHIFGKSEVLGGYVSEYERKCGSKSVLERNDRGMLRVRRAKEDEC